MSLALQTASLGFAPVAPVALPQTRAPAPVMETVADLKALAVKCNPSVGYWCAPPPGAPVGRQRCRHSASPCPSLRVGAADGAAVAQEPDRPR